MADSYTEKEALESLRQAWSRPARDPWNIPPVTTIQVENNGAQPRTYSPSPLPIIVVNNRELRDVSAEAITSLQKANEPPVLFVRSGQAVHVVSDELGRHTIVEATEAFLRGRMTRSADFRRLVHDKNRHLITHR